MKLEQQDLEAAKARWKTFHAKDEPRKIMRPELVWPTKWALAGKALVVYYASDKWHKNGRYTRYYHEHESGTVQVFHTQGLFRWLKAHAKPVSHWPTSGTVLGYCLGWDLERHDTGAHEEAVPDRGTLLCCFPDGHTLFTYHPRLGVQTLLVGSGLSVEAPGIDG